jgi:hypothetical protein
MCNIMYLAPLYMSKSIMWRRKPFIEPLHFLKFCQSEDDQNHFNNNKKKWKYICDKKSKKIYVASTDTIVFVGGISSSKGTRNMSSFGSSLRDGRIDVESHFGTSRKSRTMACDTRKQTFFTD